MTQCCRACHPEKEPKVIFKRCHPEEEPKVPTWGSRPEGAQLRGGQLNCSTYYVYILTNQSNRAMYIGVTNDLKRRLYEHENGLYEGFTKKYNVHKLVYFEQTGEISSAIAREKQLKSWSRARKNALVETLNPNWKDLKDQWE